MLDYSYWVAGIDGRPWRRNAVETLPRHAPICSKHDWFYTHVGYGFSVFDLDGVVVPPGEETDIARRMAGALTEFEAGHLTTAYLVKEMRQRVNTAMEKLDADRGDHPRVYLVVEGMPCVQGGRSPADLARDQIELMHERIRLRLATEAKATAEEGEEREHVEHDDVRSTTVENLPVDALSSGETFTYEKFVAHETVRLHLQACSRWRSRLGAHLLRATGLSPPDGVLSPDQQFLYCSNEVDTCRAEVQTTQVLLLSDCALPGQQTACVFHGVWRGLTLYGRRPGSIPCSPYLPASDVTHHVLPGHDPRQLSADLGGGPDTPTQEQLRDALNLTMASSKGDRSVHGVAVAPAQDSGMGFCAVDADDQWRSRIFPLDYTSCFAGYVALPCQAIATALGSPFDPQSGQLYGCVPLTLSTALHWTAKAQQHLRLANTAQWREALIQVSQHEAPYQFMNSDTAVSEDGKVVAWKVRRSELEEAILASEQR